MFSVHRIVHRPGVIDGEALAEQRDAGSCPADMFVEQVVERRVLDLHVEAGGLEHAAG